MEFEVFFQGKLVVKPGDSIKDIKNRILDGDITVTFDNKQLESHKTLLDYGIKKGDIIGVLPVSDEEVKDNRIPILASSTEFDAPNVDIDPKTGKTGENDYHYFAVGKGYCRNSNCKANNEPVIAIRGIGEFTPNNDQDLLGKVKCPGCKETFDYTTFYFFRCKYHILYRLKNRHTKTRKGKVKKKNCDQFGQLNGSEMATYSAMQVTTKKL